MIHIYFLHLIHTLKWIYSKRHLTEFLYLYEIQSILDSSQCIPYTRRRLAPLRSNKMLMSYLIGIIDRAPSSNMTYEIGYVF